MDENKTIKNALVITTSGWIDVFPSTWGYRELQETVEGDIEGVFLGNYGWMYCNEDGKHSSVINPAATLLFQRIYPSTLDVIYGNVVIFGPTPDEDGNDTSVSSEMLEFVSSLGFKWE
jgi:hypothetical protein